MDTNKSMAAGCFAVVILMIIMPIIIFVSGWFGGWILMKAFGNVVTDGLNTLFGTDRFTPDVIPIVFGTLATIGGYFKTSVTNSK